MNYPDNEEQCQTILNQLQQDINNLIKKVEYTLITQEVDLRNEEIQAELAKQISLLERFGEYISRMQNSRRQNKAECELLESKLNSAKLALSFLLTKKTQKIVLAKNIRYSIEYFLNRKSILGYTLNLFRRSVRELPTPTKVLLGLAMALPIYLIAIPVSLLCLALLASDMNARSTSNVLPLNPSPTQTQNFSLNSSRLQEKVEPLASQQHIFNNSRLLIMVAVAGAFGSIVSILIRLQDYRDEDAYAGSATPILVGFAKPLIGTAFGIFIFTLIGSKIVSFPIIDSLNKEPQNNEQQNNDDIKYYFFFSVAFVFGFSERLDHDIVERVGRSLSLQKSAKKIQEEVQESTEDIHQATDNVRTIMPEVNEVVQDAKQILPEVKAVVEDTQHPTPDEPFKKL